MKFNVVWTASAQNQLARIWLNSANRDLILAAVREIERALALNPEDAGESRVVNIRILLAAPLGIYFDVSPPDRRVKVFRVWSYAKQP